MDKDTKTIRTKNCLSKKWCCDDCLYAIIYAKNALPCMPHTIYKNRFKMDHTPKCESKTIKILEKIKVCEFGMGSIF